MTVLVPGIPSGSGGATAAPPGVGGLGTPVPPPVGAETGRNAYVASDGRVYRCGHQPAGLPSAPGAPVTLAPCPPNGSPPPSTTASATGTATTGTFVDASGRTVQCRLRGLDDGRRGQVMGIPGTRPTRRTLADASLPICPTSGVTVSAGPPPDGPGTVTLDDLLPAGETSTAAGGGLGQAPPLPTGQLLLAGAAALALLFALKK